MTILLYGFATAESPEAITKFLEEFTGEASVSEVKVQQNEGLKAYAIVEFKTKEAADKIMSLSAERLWYGNSYLKARDLVGPSKPKNIQHKFDDVRLQLGFQTSEMKFSTLWTQDNVTLKFGSGLRKFIIFLRYESVDYKLELSYEKIRQVEMRRPRGQTKKFIVIQLLAAPQVFVHNLPGQNYSIEDASLRWVNEVDFTPSFCIGQSSAMCLEFPISSNLPDLQKEFAYFKESEGKFTMNRGSTFSNHSDLVPIVNPPEGFNLPFQIMFKINILVQHCCLPRPVVDVNFFRMVEPHRRNPTYIEHVLEDLFYMKECCFEPVRWLKAQYRKYIEMSRPPMSPAISLSGGLVYIRKVLVTPCKVYFFGPEVILASRVLRCYPDDIDNFLRVSFVDDDLAKLRPSDLSPRDARGNKSKYSRLYQRILSTLRNGIVISDKKFEFLAFSNSQLKDNSLWMFASRPGLTAADIRKNLGDFSEIRNVAKYAARLGQSFSSSRESVDVDSDEIEIIPDVEVERGGVKYTFSDGIGKISVNLAQIVAKKCGFRNTPSALQIRYAGYKGVVAIDPTSTKKLSMRKSMCKYKSHSTGLDILAWSKYQPCYLNRQLVILLSTLGVPDYMFEEKQQDMISRLDSILTDPLKAQEALDLMPAGETTRVLKEMLDYYQKPGEEPFLSAMLQVYRASTLQDLKIKQRIFVRRGQTMMGCLDETGILQYGEVFVQYSGGRPTRSSNNFSSMFSGSESDQCKILRGKVAVAKNPCLHPGDVRVLNAVDVPDLHHMVDCVVFPAKGPRPHPDECSGSDLDGDVYFVCWDPYLIPPGQYPPMDYRGPPAKINHNDITIEDVEEHFADYIVNENLGSISNSHIAFADKSPYKAACKECIQLAKLASIALDFGKTGVPAIVPRHLRARTFPDYLEKHDRESYISQTLIGRLYRQVKHLVPNSASIIATAREAGRQFYDLDMEVDGFKDYIEDAFYYKSQYDYRLGNLMDYFGISTEAEILSGCFLKMAKSFSKKRDLEAITFAVRSLRNEARDWFNKMASDSGSSTENLYKIASAWYHVTYHPSYRGRCNEGLKRDHYFSFPWCVHDKLLQIKRDRQNVLKTLHYSSLMA